MRDGKMFEIGVKLWSINIGGCMQEARRMCMEGVCDYVELYVVPGTLGTLSQWRELGVPMIIHAPHFKHGFNLALANRSECNKLMYEEVQRFADGVEARYIIFHGGTYGNISETAHQLALLQEPRALIENKPAITYNEGCILECRGSTVEEIRQVLASVGCGFCLDIPHALCAANYHQTNREETLRDFCSLAPTMFHLADMMDISQLVDDHTPLGQGNLDMARLISIALPRGSMVTIETNRRRADDLSEFRAEMECLHRAVLSLC